MATKRLIDANEVMQRNEEAYKKAQDNPAKKFCKRDSISNSERNGNFLAHRGCCGSGAV